MKHVLTTLILILSTSFLFGQAKKVENINVSSSKVVFLGKSKPLIDLIKRESKSTKKNNNVEKSGKGHVNFRSKSSKHRVVKPELEHLGLDPVWQSTHSINSSINEPLLNFNGLIRTNGSPHDPTLAVGINYILQAVNPTSFDNNVPDVGVWDKTGNEIIQFKMETLWTEFGASSEGDPILLFDQEAEQWMVTEFTDPANLLIAISETSDPLGSYYAYTFSTPSFPDYPKYAIWSDHYVVTTNEGGSGTLTQYFIERDSLLIGAEARMQQVEVTGTSGSEQGFITSTPVDWEGLMRPEDPRPIVVKLNDSSWGQVDNDAIELYRFSINYEDESATQVESVLINTAPYDSYPCGAAGPGFACIPQPNGNGLDAVPEVIMHSPQYRNFGSHESMVLSFVTDVTDGEDHAGVRWIEMRKSDGLDWSIYQEGSYAPDANHRYLSGVAMDRKGNIGLAYNISSDSVFAGIRYTGRFATDQLGTMTLPEVSVIEGNSTLNTFGRFADYSHIAVDPVDETTFWFTSEYANNGRSETRIVSFELSQDSFDLALTSIVNPNSGFDLSNAESVEVEVLNSGINEAASYNISLSLEGVELETITITDPIASGETRLHTFNNTIDMSAIGDYNLSASVIYQNDENPNNNTVNKTVSQRTAINASIDVSAPSIVCNIASLVSITVGNEGGIELTDASIEFFLDGALVETEEWTGNLQFGESTTFDYLLTNIPEGENEYEVVITHGAGEDLIPDNNTTTFSINSIGPDGLVILELTTDDYPDETAWFIYEEGESEPIYQSVGYDEDFTTYTEQLCLDPNGCYTFEITDSYGDGICCGFGDGNYILFNGQGAPIFSSTGEFGESEVTNFCVSDVECNLSAEVEVQDVAVDGTLGSILIIPSGGVAPYTYSIDGGETTQESNLFDNLEADDYVITISFADGACIEEILVTVDMLSSIEDDFNNAIKISSTPNPNEGFFDLSIENYQSNEVFIHFNVLDAEGKLVQSRRMANYSGVYKTQVSLLEYPSGTYFIRFLEKDITQLVKIIKL